MTDHFYPLLMHKGSSQFRHHFVRLRRLHTVNQNRFGRLSGDNAVESITCTPASRDRRLTHTHVDLLLMLAGGVLANDRHRSVRIKRVQVLGTEWLLHAALAAVAQAAGAARSGRGYGYCERFTPGLTTCSPPTM